MANHGRTPEPGDTGQRTPEPGHTGQGTPEPGDTGQGERRRRRELWLSLPGLIVTTVVVGIVSWGVTRLTDGAEKLTQDDAPLAMVSVETNPARVGAFDDTSVHGVLPKGATPTTGPGDGCTGFHDWLLKNGGTDAGESRLQVTVQGNAQRQAQITNLRVVVVSREKPASHVGVGCPSAGSANLRFITIDLDSPRPRAEYDSEDGAPFGFTVEPGEIETFLITATAKEAVYNWYLELDLVSGDERVHMRVDDDGKNFQTSPKARTPAWDWDGKSKWVHAESGRQRAVGDPLVPPGQAGEDTP